MIPAALANAFYTKDIPFAPTPIAIEHDAGSNVVAVDFVRRRPRELNGQASDAAGHMEWLTIATARLSGLNRFSDGWDGPASRAVSDVALLKAEQVLRFAFCGIVSAAPPAAVPCADGSLQLEWWLTDTRFEFCIEADGSMGAWGLDRTSQHEVEADGDAAIELLAKWSGRLTADKLAQLA